MPSTSLSATAWSTDLSVSLLLSATDLWNWMLLEKAARGADDTPTTRGSVARRRAAASVRNDMAVLMCGFHADEVDVSAV